MSASGLLQTFVTVGENFHRDNVLPFSHRLQPAKSRHSIRTDITTANPTDTGDLSTTSQSMKTKMSGVPSQAILSKAFLETGRDDVIKWEAFPIDEGRELVLTFEEWKRTSRHGVRLAVDGGLIVNGHAAPSVELWSDTAPNEIKIEVRDSKGILSVYNLWDSGSGRQSQSYTSGMLIEQLPKGRRYRCNDIGLATSLTT